MSKKRFFTILPILITLLSVLSIAPYSKIDLFNTTFWWLFELCFLLIFWRVKIIFFDKSLSSSNFLFISIYIYWILFCAFRGILIAETYWDWKALIDNSMALLLPITAYSLSNIFLSQAILKVYIKYSLPLFFLLAPIISKDSYGFYLVPISIIFLFFPTLTFRLKITAIFFTLVVLFADFDARSNLIKFSVPILMFGLYYLRNTLVINFFEIARKTLFFIPILFLGLAISNTFNVFDMDKYIKADRRELRRDDRGEVVEVSMKADTRTFLYVEVLKSAIKYDYWFLGRTPARGNESPSFSNYAITGRNERMTNEVAILNVFTWTGLVGVLLYMLVFYKASYLAINYSNNVYSKILGIYTSFRWVYAWVEDVNIFTLTTFMLWFMLALCVSKSFRRLNDIEVEMWVKGILRKGFN